MLPSNKSRLSRAWTAILDWFWIVEPGESHLHAAWAHVTSWWVYPAMTIVFFPMLVLVIADVERQIALLLIRFVGVSAMVVVPYERFVRTPKRKAARLHKGTKHHPNIAPGFWSLR